MIIELPFSSDGAQRVTTQLGDRKYIFEVRFNERSGVWTFNMFDAVTEAEILLGLPLVLGQDLLEPYNLEIGAMIVSDTTGQSKEAGPDDLGNRVKVHWVSPDEI